MASLTGIHPTAVVDPHAHLGVDVVVGPCAVIEAGARIGDRVRIGASAFVSAVCEIGPDCVIDVGAVLGGRAQIRGLSGEGGRVVVGARNEIREHVTIHRASQPGRATVLGDDNLLLAGCHIAHDCRVGHRTTIANGVRLAGHVEIGDGAFLSGNVLVHQFTRIGALAMVSGQARISRDVPPFAVAIGDSEVCGVNVVGMRRAGMSSEARLNARRVYTAVYRAVRTATKAVALLRTLPPTPESEQWLAFLQSSARGMCAPRRRHHAHRQS